MKVCIINNIYPPYDRGGAEQVIIRIVNGLRHAGHEVVLLTSSPNGEEYNEDENLKIYRIKPPNIFFYTRMHNHSFLGRGLWHLIDMFNMTTARWVKGILKKEQPDIVHTHNLMGLSFIIPQTIRKLGLRHIHTVHDVQLVEPSAMILKEKEHSWRFTGFPTKLYTAVMRKLMGSPDVIISPSEFLRDFYTKRGFFKESELVVLRNPLTVDITPRSTSHNEKPFHFLYLGQVEHHKGVHLLAEAFAEFNTSQKEVKLSVVGSGSLLKHVKGIASETESIQCLGRVGRDRLPNIFSEVDMTIVPSLCYENSPTVIFESFAFGVPVLASDIEGIAELIENKQNGLTFKAGDKNDLIQKMTWCVDHASEVKEMGKNTTTLLENLTEEAYIKGLMKLYAEKN